MLLKQEHAIGQQRRGEQRARDSVRKLAQMWMWVGVDMW